ncbi:MAG: hypothetical protein Q9197_005289, partial [Variospora fuerteventurae]
MSNPLLLSHRIPPLTRKSIRTYSSRLGAIPLCPQCRSALFPSASPLHSVPTTAQQRYPFTTTPWPLSKHGGKKASKNTVSVNAQKTSSLDDNTDPNDFSALEANIEKIVTGLRDDVRRIKPGGVDVEAVGEIRVALKKAGGSAVKGGKAGRKDVVKVGELAQVVPRGRVLVLLVAEKE